MWNSLYAKMMSEAISNLLHKGEPGQMAFTRCLPPEIATALVQDPNFVLEGWKSYLVAGQTDLPRKTITADVAVELRESKAEPVFLLVDVDSAGAGMDGIYSAAREIREDDLFSEALRIARLEVKKARSVEDRDLAERALKKSRKRGQKQARSPWTEFGFLAEIAAQRRYPGELFYQIGLWPISESASGQYTDEYLIDESKLFVDRLLGPGSANQTPGQRVESLNLCRPDPEQRAEMERFLNDSATLPLQMAIESLASLRTIWIGQIFRDLNNATVEKIEMIPWLDRKGKLLKWSGLVAQEDDDAPPELILDPEADRNGNYSKLEVRWRATPNGLEKGAADYRVAIVTDMEEEITSYDIRHNGKANESCKFSNDDFSFLGDEARGISVKIVVSVVGNEQVDPVTSEEFQIRFGQRGVDKPASAGKLVRAFCEGLIEHDDTVAVGLAFDRPIDGKGYRVLRSHRLGKSYKVYVPPLLRELDEIWVKEGGAIGRWTVQVRASGTRAGKLEFIPFNVAYAASESAWNRVCNASRNIAELFAAQGGCGQIYYQEARDFDSTYKEYLLSWIAALDNDQPLLALANTIEVRAMSGQTIGLIVPPSHPIRVAWHVAYDNLVFNTAFREKQKPLQIREEFETLDGAMFPAFLPGLTDDTTFVFADTLGFHAVGMVADNDREPKASLAMLAKVLGDNKGIESPPTISRKSSEILGGEIFKYARSHNASRNLRIHALRAGDGQVVARSLGYALKSIEQAEEDEEAGEKRGSGVSFTLELYSTDKQRVMAGRYIAETREKRRTGAGYVAEDERWMLKSETRPGGVNIPRLRWARKKGKPEVAAHLAVAFDAFESRVCGETEAAEKRTRPHFAYGLLSFFDRQYTGGKTHVWHSHHHVGEEGEKHPADRHHTERLFRLVQAIDKCVSKNIGGMGGLSLKTEITPETTRELQELHHLCDWVITMDRIGGMEYFDSPRNDRKLYDTYVIDCVPEREDLGSMRLVTSTSCMDEVRRLLNKTLDQMGLSQSPRNAEFLMSNLKALSGRLAIRLAGQTVQTSELVALALSRAYAFQADGNHKCWPSLRDGCFIPMDDVRDLLPPAGKRDGDPAGNQSGAVRPDLLYVGLDMKGKLQFRFIEVKYRRHLRDARSSNLIFAAKKQVEAMSQRWHDWYLDENIAVPFRAVRRARLARVLHFYADKARRHADDTNKQGLSAEAHQALLDEINKMIEHGSRYTFVRKDDPAGRVWIFCPEYAGEVPLEITADGGENCSVFLFGPQPLPDWPHLFVMVNDESQGLMQSSHERDNEQTSIHSDGTTPCAGMDTGIGAEDMSTTVPIFAEASVTENLNESPIKPIPSTSMIFDDVNIFLGKNCMSGGKVTWPVSIKGNPHLLMAGLPGMGKTTCLLNIIRQMSAAGIRPIVFSYHEDIDQKLETTIGDIRFVDFHGLGFNPLEVVDRQNRQGFLDVAGALRDIFCAIFPELGDIQGERVRNAVKESFIEVGWGSGTDILEGLREPPFKRFFEILKAAPKPDRGLQTLLARLQELADYDFFDATGQQESLWDSEGPTVIRIHKTRNDVLQNAFASLVFYKLYKDMFRRGIQQRITHALFFDEAHRAARLSLIPTMAKECRKYGISLVLASQEAKDFHSSLFSAIAGYLVLRVTEADARVLVRKVSSSDQERAWIDRIKQMEKYRALYFSETQRKPCVTALSE